ncbi:MAG: hypothetical protein LUD76_02800 [Alistipes sp.]|nr:hypothetical protein [Alistipes sp.]
MNEISHVKFDLLTDSEQFARQLFSRWDGFYSTSVESPAGAAMDSLCTDEPVMVKCLEIDVGELEEDRFYGQFAEKFREAFAVALRRSLETNDSDLSVSTGHARKNAFEILCGFLLNGYLPPGRMGEYGKDLNGLFLFVLENHGPEFVRFLRTYGHYTSLQRRMVYQFDDEVLENGVRTIAPSEAGFVCSYVRLLNKKFAGEGVSGMRREDRRYVVWSVVYSYLLDDRGSYFNRKRFVCGTIASLSGRYNITFTRLVCLITDEAEAYTRGWSGIPELIRLLSEIRRETENSENHKLSADRDRLFRIFYYELQHGSLLPDHPFMPVLRAVLSEEESCRRFLHPLKETEMERLARAVSPRQGGFVIGYSRELDRQNTAGTLQGRTSGDFRTVKWCILFRLLLSGGEQGFNRKAYVRSVIGQITARYNLYMADILGFMAGAVTGLHTADRELAVIIGELWTECRPSDSGRSIDDGALLEGLYTVLTTGTKPEPVFLAELVRRLQERSFRESLAVKLSRGQVLALTGFLHDSQTGIESLLRVLLHVLDGTAAVSGPAREERLKVAVLDAISGYCSGPPDIKTLVKVLSDSYNMDHGELLCLLMLRASTFPPSVSRETVNLWDQYYRYRPLQDMVTSLKSSGMTVAARSLYEAIDKAMDFYPVLTRTGIDIEKVRYETMVRDWILKIIFTAGSSAHNRGGLTAVVLNKLWMLTGLPESELPDTLRTVMMPRFDKVEVTEGVAINKIGHHPVPIRSQGGGEKGSGADSPSERGPEWVTGHQDRKTKALVTSGIKAAAASDTRPVLGMEGGENLESILLRNDESDNRSGRASGNGGIKTREGMKSGSGPEKLSVPETADAIFRESPSGLELSNSPESEPVFISNAGMVLLAPFYPRLFTVTGLTSDNIFPGIKQKCKALYLLQYAVWGEPYFPEYELPLNKILVGLEKAEPVERYVPLIPDELADADSMLEGAILHWTKLKGSSAEALREGFLQRDGRLEFLADRIELAVETKSYDMLLDSLPWSYSVVKYPWMPQPLMVKWR